jgi:hypothetical protein
MCIMHMMPGPSSDGQFNTFICYPTSSCCMLLLLLPMANAAAGLLLISYPSIGCISSS